MCQPGTVWPAFVDPWVRNGQDELVSIGPRRAHHAPGGALPEADSIDVRIRWKHGGQGPRQRDAVVRCVGARREAIALRQQRLHPDARQPGHLFLGGVSDLIQVVGLEQLDAPLAPLEIVEDQKAARHDQQTHDRRDNGDPERDHGLHGVRPLLVSSVRGSSWQGRRSRRCAR